MINVSQLYWKVEDHDHDEVEEIGNVGDEQEDGQGGPLQKRRRISGEPFVLVRPRWVDAEVHLKFKLGINDIIYLGV